MTIIALRGGWLAADSLITSGDVVTGSLNKLARVPGGRVAMYGYMAEAQMVVEWLVAGKPGPMPQSSHNETGVVIYVPDRGPVRRLLLGTDVEIPRAPFHAWGAGTEFALGAMAAGASAEEAVRIACRLSTGCGGRVRVLGP